MIKIAFFINDLSHGGIQKSIVNLLNNIDLNLYKVDLYYFSDDTFFKDDIVSKVKLIKLPEVNFIYKFLPYNIAKRIYKGIKINDSYDYAVDFDTYQFKTAYYATNIVSKKRIMWIHNDIVEECKNNIKYKILHSFMKGKYSLFDGFVGVSDGVIKPFQVKNNIFNADFWVIPNYIDTNEIFIKSSEKVTDIKIDRNKYNLISVGRLCFQKGYDIFLKDLKKIIVSRRDIHFYLLGDGEKKEELKKLVKKYNLSNYVTFIGKSTNPFKYEKLMDGFVLTSRYEGQGMAILEAYSLGLEIFISKNIEKYNGYNIKGRDDLVLSIIKAKKTKKIKHNLQDYNDDITKKINTLFHKK